MKKLQLIGYVIVIIIFSIRCSSPNYLVSEYGDRAIIVFNNGHELNCEIICFLDTSIVVSPFLDKFQGIAQQPYSLFYVNYSELASLSIEGFDGRGWGTGVLLFQVVPVGLLAIAAISAEADALSAIVIFGFPAAITSLFLSGSDGETPRWNNKDILSKIVDLSIYSRYPNGMSGEEMNQLIEGSIQKEIKKFDMSY
jgi:hypothetical protein